MTADQEFWKKDEKILFLGQWCQVFSQQHVLQQLDYEVLPYHWDDRKKLYKDYHYLNCLYENILTEFSEHLNIIHNVNHSKRYWRILIGPWLYYFIQVLYDRYETIRVAEESGKVTDVLVSDAENERFIPSDYYEFNEWVFTDRYNQYLYSQIIKYRNRLPFNTLKPKRRETEKGNSSRNHTASNSINRIIADIVKSSEDYLAKRFDRIILIASGLGMKDLIKMHITLRQFPYLTSPKVPAPRIDIDTDLRERIYWRSDSNAFEKLLGTIIGKQIPALYLEGYAEMNRNSLTQFPSRPKVIFTASAIYTNDAFKFWAAYHVDRGTKLLGTQHGGHYGTGLWYSLEKHELNIYDKFYTWGWKADEYDNTGVISAAMLNRMIGTVRAKKEGRLLMVLMCIPRYSYHLYTCPVSSSGYLAYLEEQYRFAEALSKADREILLVRLYGRDFCWGQKDRWKSRFPDIECDRASKPLIDQLNESKLFIGTYNSTTYLETFVANFPTVLFWNPAHWEVRTSATIHFKKLREVGILHDTPESAAKKVSEISHDPASWWNDPEVQAVKAEFCSQYASMSNGWMSEWRSELMKWIRN